MLKTTQKDSSYSCPPQMTTHWCGGTLGKHIGVGDEVHILILGDGKVQTK